MWALAVSIVSLPPSGIASRALTAKFSSAASTSFGSTSTRQSPAPSTVSIAIVSPSVRCMSSDAPWTSALTSIGFGSSGCRRENARSRCVSAAARRAPFIA